MLSIHYLSDDNNLKTEEKGFSSVTVREDLSLMRNNFLKSCPFLVSMLTVFFEDNSVI